MTTTFNLITRPYTLITNDVRVVLYKASDPTVIVTSQQFAAPHGQRTWTFPGLLRTNYIVKILEVNGATIVQQLDDFTIVPDSRDIKIKQSRLIQVDSEPGLTTGNTSATFDGTAGKDDWRGWTPHIELIGAGTSKVAIDYTFDSTTGTWTSTVPFEPDVYYFVEFEPIISTGAGGVPITADLWSENKVISDNTNLLTDDWGKNILLKGAAPYEVTLPDISTVPVNKLTFFESDNNACVSLKSSNANAINWLEGNRTKIYIRKSESLAIYREKIDDTTSRWRVKNAEGNFKRVGEVFSSYADTILNAIEFTGGQYDKNEHARLYNDHVLTQNAGNVVAYADWNANQTKFSFADATTGKFRVPNLSNLYERVTDGTKKQGDFQDEQVGKHNHRMKVWGDNPTLAYGVETILIPQNMEDFSTGANNKNVVETTDYNNVADRLTDTENRVKCYIVKKFVYE
jgi:hypothetical protein